MVEKHKRSVTRALILLVVCIGLGLCLVVVLCFFCGVCERVEIERIRLPERIRSKIAEEAEVNREQSSAHPRPASEL